MIKPCFFLIFIAPPINLVHLIRFTKLSVRISYGCNYVLAKKRLSADINFVWLFTNCRGNSYCIFFSLEIVNLFSQNLFALGALNQEEGCIPKAKVDILPAVRQNRIFICQRSNSCNSCKPMITSHFHLYLMN